MRKIVTFGSWIILGIALLCLFAWAVIHVNEGGKKLGIFTKPIKVFVLIPEMVASVGKEVANPERLKQIDPDFEASNRLDYDVYGLAARYEPSKWIIELENLRNDSVLFSWYLREEDHVEKYRVYSHVEPRSPILLSDTSLIVHNDETNNLFRIDAASKILWHNTDHQFHHGINLGYDGNIWTCTREYVQSVAFNFLYWENYLTQIDVHTGQTIFHKPLTEIFYENDLAYLVHGIGNSLKRNLADDPFHLNEIQPVLEDGKYWQKGDLLVSLRNRSMILLYRPSTNQILRTIQGPFYSQHDVDIQSDSTISLFNNNTTSLKGMTNLAKDEYELLPNPTLNSASNVLVYNLSDSTFTSLYPERFAENQIFTWTQGLHHVMANGDLFVESQNEGKVFIFNEQQTLLKAYYNEIVNGLVEYPHWTRIYEDLQFLK